ncbi:MULTISPECIES: AMP-binding protein [Rhodopseudomonas]|uniref:3-methylmercaptopropionyl-CoA ligase n=1 Tax=Rhodopseudomonas palustris TaxID=1076 RepID=A0A0D7EFF6_RHOPL|nr:MULTISPECIES: AMP-binding protein [Rhodopseudomonas]KIZ39473.1 AMP-dependent synthetase [Rhodopseudomonas palustris]MDF3811955.1 AMP-binding protein [Rhodopseudomonas sp. BAL398]WOK19688.1 AMP-binding protein [Rhodopseudomonas sp. BAL398]
MTNLQATGGVPGPGRIGRVAIGDLLKRAARRFPERVALTDGERRVSYDELERDANRFANYLVSRGLQPGAKISTICNNSVEFVKALFGIHRAGLVWVPINTMLGPDDMSYILDHAEVKFALIDDNLHAQTERRAALQQRGIAMVAIDLTGTAAAAGLQSFYQLIEGQSDREPEIAFDDRDLAMIIYTSGTTSRPKGAMHCHLAVVMAVMSNCIEIHLDRNDGITGQFPLFHCAAHVLLLSYLAVGGKMSILRGFDPVACMQAIERDRLSIFIGLPAMYQVILDHPRRKEFDLSSLRACVYTMAPMPRPLLERCIKELCPNFMQPSGQTEMYPATTMSQPDRQLERFGNYWGESMIVNETAIMDDDGHLLPPGEIGELVHRGPNVMMGYYKDPDATEAARKFGWHHTGDLALIDAHGEVLFIDRKKDMIKSGGENVASVRIEETLLAHPAVANAAVVGLPHPQWGEAVSAFVKLKPAAEATEAGLLEHCKAHLGGFQVPKLIRIVAEMPMTATGKLRKVELRNQFADFFASDQARSA